MLRDLRRRFGTSRGAPLASFALRVLAVSPFPDEPTDDKDYHPTLIVTSIPEPDAGAAGGGAFVLGALLFADWAQGRLGEATLPLRLRALVPRLRVAVRGGRLGPEGYARHRAAQAERYFHQREAATFDLALHRDADGLYLAVKRRVADGRWTEEAALLEAATLAPYEALLRLDPAAALAALDWLDWAVERWLAELPADFPVDRWDPAVSLTPPPPGSAEC